MFAVRWLRPTGADLSRRAVAEIRALTDGARRRARILEKSPHRVTIPGFHWGSRMTVEEVAQALSVQHAETGRAGAVTEQQIYKDRIRDLTQELENERRRSMKLVARIAVMEANAARLGLDPEEMHRPLLKPLRSVSRAGGGNSAGTTRRHSF